MMGYQFILRINQKELLYSMKRKTVNEIDFIQPIRTIKKNKSCQLHYKSLKINSKEGKRRKEHEFASALTVVDLFVSELIESLDSQLREADQKKWQESMVEYINATTSSLSAMINPIPLSEQSTLKRNVCEQEPRSISCDLMCVGNPNVWENKLRKMPRISIAVREEAHKRNQSLFGTSKQVQSSKCLIKLPRQQYLQRRQGLEALKDYQPEKRDVLEDLLRDKITKDKKNLYFNQGIIEGLAKPNILPSIEEYSFDYDGSLFPIKKGSIQNSVRIKVLNTTCKVINKDIIEQRKQSIVSKLHGTYLKTQIQENEKENKKNVEQQKRVLSLRKHSNTNSMKDLSTFFTQDEASLKSKIQESIRDKAIKIRQLKAN